MSSVNLCERRRVQQSTNCQAEALRSSHCFTVWYESVAVAPAAAGMPTFTCPSCADIHAWVHVKHAPHALTSMLGPRQQAPGVRPSTPGPMFNMPVIAAVLHSGAGDQQCAAVAAERGAGATPEPHAAAADHAHHQVRGGRAGEGLCGRGYGRQGEGNKRWWQNRIP